MEPAHMRRTAAFSKKQILQAESMLLPNWLPNRKLFPPATWDIAVRKQTNKQQQQSTQKYYKEMLHLHNHFHRVTEKLRFRGTSAGLWSNLLLKAGSAVIKAGSARSQRKSKRLLKKVFCLFLCPSAQCSCKIIRTVDDAYVTGCVTKKLIKH